MEIETVLAILEEFQSLIFLRTHRKMSSEEIEEFLNEYLEDMSFIEE